jgi:hypothetical protein
VASSPRAAETAEIEGVLGRYRSAFEAFDVSAVAAIWPTVNARALENAFGQLQKQDLSFNDCAIDVSGRSARAVCRGTATFVPKVGGRSPHTESRQWTFQLFRAGENWRLERVDSR